MPTSPLLRGVCHLSGLQQGPRGKGTVLQSRIRIPALVLYYNTKCFLSASHQAASLVGILLL